MKFLLDMPVSPQLCDWLNGKGFKAVHASKIGMDKAKDRDIIMFARKEKSIIITADLDFPRLIALAGESSPALILFRGGNYSENEMRGLLERVLQAVSFEDIKKSIIVVDKFRIRKNRLPIG